MNPLITKYDLDQAIAECQGVRDPNANTCIKLAAYYTIRDAMFGVNNKEDAVKTIPQYSFAARPTISYASDSEFASIINSKNPDKIWPIVDELIETIRIIYPKLYEVTMKKVKDALG